MRKRYSREFKLRAVRTLVESGRSVCDVANDLGIEFSILYRWKGKYLGDLHSSGMMNNESDSCLSQDG